MVIKGKGLKAGIIGLASLFLFSGLSFGECKDYKVKFRRKNYNVCIDDDRFIYRINPKSPEKEEILASAIIMDYIEKSKKRAEVLEEKIEEFIQRNPSEMFPEYDCRDVDVESLSKTPLYFEKPPLNVTARRKGKMIELTAILDSDDFFLRWEKDSSVIIGYPKSTRITRRADRSYELDFNSTDKISRKHKIMEVSFPEAREAGGFILSTLELKSKTLLKKAGFAGKCLIAGMELQEWFESLDRKTREKKLKSSITDTKRKYSIHQPWPVFPQGFQSHYEVGRVFAIDIKTEEIPERIDFLINTNLYVNTLNPLKEATSLKNDSVMLKAISVYLHEPTEKTVAGRAVKTGRLIANNINDFEDEWKEGNISDIGAKGGFYHKLRLWEIRAYPFAAFLDSVKGKSLNGNLKDLDGFKRYEKTVEGIEKAALPLRSLLIKYNEERSTTNTLDTFEYLKTLSEAIKTYYRERKNYPDSLEDLVFGGYLNEIKRDEWGRSIMYKKMISDGKEEGFELRSAGKNGEFNDWKTSGDDVALGTIYP